MNRQVTQQETSSQAHLIIWFVWLHELNCLSPLPEEHGLRITDPPQIYLISTQEG